MTLDELKEKLDKEMQAATTLYNGVVANINATYAKISEYENLKNLVITLRKEWYAIRDTDVVFQTFDGKKRYEYFSAYKYLQPNFKEVENTSYTEENEHLEVNPIKFLPDVISDDYLKLIEPEIKICMLNSRYDLIITYETRVEELRVELGIDPDNNQTKNKVFKKY